MLANVSWWIPATVLCGLLMTPIDVDHIKPDHAGLLMTESARIVPGLYELFDQTGQGAITIAGNDVTVDFTGATLVGAPTGTDPDAMVGKGIVVRGRNVTLINANVRGYKIGIYAEDSPGLTLRGCDVSRNYRQRLKSGIEHEDLSDWLYGHENDKNEWLRYGAGIYLFRCPSATVVDCRARNGQNGLCISRCDRARVVDNDMSFMSGWGLAMWRSNECEVFNNRFDWCMRGYSHGVYSRGQDSAGILVYEQCGDNIFAYNSATHSGDGLFLYAGNETLEETGRGGCNGNILYRNDFSHAAANGIEATFSDGNIFIENTLEECTHGVWAGYSYNTIIENNTISDCTYGISIEHGRNNRIAGNNIRDTPLGIHLWWDDDEDLLASAFGQANNRCPSRNNRVIANRFERVQTAIRLTDDTHSVIKANTMTSVETPVHLAGNVDGAKVGLTESQRAAVKNKSRGTVLFEVADKADGTWTPLDIMARRSRLQAGKGSQNAFLSGDARRGRAYIFIDQWGPYDFTDVRVFPSHLVGGRRGVIQLLGPDSTFRVTSASGHVKVTPMEGQLPAKLTVDTTEKGLHTFTVDIETEGYSHRATGSLLNADWHVAFYAWSKADDPRKDPDAWRRIVATEPRDEVTSPAIDFVWYTRAPTGNVPRDRFATVATTNVRLPRGPWRVRTVSDDGVRVFVDEKEVLSNWSWHAATSDETMVELEAGQHNIRIEHFEIDGYAQLQFRLEPAVK